MYKVILFNFIFFTLTLGTRIEQMIAVRDLAEQYMKIFAPHTCMCKNGDLQVNLHKIARNGTILETIKAHQNQTVNWNNTDASKLIILIPGHNDDPTGHAVRMAATALKSSIYNVDVYVVERKQVRKQNPPLNS